MTTAMGDRSVLQDSPLHNRMCGTLYLNIDTTMHDVWDLYVVMQQWYGYWHLPKDAAPAMRVLRSMAENDPSLWKNYDFDPQPDRTTDMYSTLIKSRQEHESWMPETIRLVLWDAYVSYRERALRLVDLVNGYNASRAREIRTYMYLSNRCREYHSEILADVSRKQMRDMEDVVRQATGMPYFTMKERLKAAQEFTQYS